jgi:GTPase SAR1 family protein
MEQFQSLLPSYCRDSDVFVLTTAINLVESFEAILTYRNFISNLSSRVSPVILAVNKMDLTENLVGSIHEIQERYQPDFAAIFFVSAKNGDNVNEMFQHAAELAARASVIPSHASQGPPTGRRSCCKS